MGTTLSNSEFQERVFKETHGEFDFIEKYGGAKTPIQCLHRRCGNIFKITPDLLRRKIKNHRHTCPNCRRFYHHTTTGDNRHFIPKMEVRCKFKHRFSLPIELVPAFHAGLIECPICKKLKILDPQYRNAIVDFSFERKLRRRGDSLL